MSDRLQGGIKAGSTSLSIPIIMRKTADNTELTGATSGSFTLAYWRQGSAAVTITSATLTSVGTAAWAEGGMFEVSSTLNAGLYRLDVPDAAIATGADWVVFSAKVSTTYAFHYHLNLTTNTVQSANMGGTNVTVGAMAVNVTVTSMGSTGVTVTNVGSVALASIQNVNVTVTNMATGVTVTAVGSTALASIQNVNTTVGAMAVNVTITSMGGTGVTVTNVGSVALASIQNVNTTVGAMAVNVTITSMGGTGVTVTNVGAVALASIQNVNVTVTNMATAVTVTSLVTGAVVTVGTMATGVTVTAVGATALASIQNVNVTVGAMAVGVTTTSIAAAALAQVKAEVTNALYADAQAEVTTIPAATSPSMIKMGYLFAVVANKQEQTATNRTIYEANATTVLATVSVSDNGTTFTRGAHA